MWESGLKAWMQGTEQKRNGDAFKRVTVSKSVCKKLSLAALTSRAVAACEFLNSACRIDELVLTGEERVASGANTDL